MDEPTKKTLQIAIISVTVIVIVLVVMGYFLFSAPEPTTTIRDIAIIVLALESIVVLLLLGVVVGLLWWLIQTLERKVTPILDSTSETVDTARGTATFVSDTVVSPIIKVISYTSGAKRAVQVLTKLRGKRSE